jgi:hypothetical protein
MQARRWAIGLGTAAGALVLAAAAAWACVPVATLNVNPTQVTAGQEVTVTGGSYNNAKPVVMRWGGLDGPVLAELTTSGGRINGTVTVPADARPGNYVLLATQETAPGATTWGVPARVLISVTGDTAPLLGAPVGSQAADRPEGLFENDGVSGGSLLLAGLGAAGVAMFLAGMAALLSSRRAGSAGAPARVRSS